LPSERKTQKGIIPENIIPAALGVANMVIIYSPGVIGVVRRNIKWHRFLAMLRETLLTSLV